MMPHRSEPDCLEARARAIVTALGGRWTAHSARSGALCRCPAHDDRTPSLSVRRGTTTLLFHCFGAGCSAADILTALRRQGLWPAPQTVRHARSSPRASPGPKRGAQEGSDSTSRAALALWHRAKPLTGTLGERYLVGRGLTPPHASLRTLNACPLGSGPQARFHPALIAAVANESGLIAIHRTYLAADGSKALFAQPRRALGRLLDGAVRLYPQAQQLGLAEGIETAIAAHQLLGLPVWAVLGAERLPSIALPGGVREVVLLPDPDPAGLSRIAAARSAYEAQGRRVRVVLPPTEQISAHHAKAPDWNDVLLAQQREGGLGAG